MEDKTEQQQLTEAKQTIQQLLTEVQKIGASALELATQLGVRQAEGDALRNRLRKTLAAFQAASSYILALESGQCCSAPGDMVQKKKSEYSQALLDLETPDDG